MILKNFKTTYAMVVIAMLIAESCSENSTLLKPVQNSSTTKKTLPNGRIVNYSFDGTEGDAIDGEVARRWITNYSNNSSISAHFFGNKFLLKMLSQTGAVGIRFYYSKADNGNHHLLAVPAGGNGNDFPFQFEGRGMNSSVNLAFQGSPNTFTGDESDSVSSQTGKHLIDNYNVSNPNGIQAHFFGHEIIRQILLQSHCIGIRCYYALNDSGVQQLLLVGVTSSGENILPNATQGGRVNGDGTIADVSSPCPSYCSGQ
jgi:hypothetical protein